MVEEAGEILESHIMTAMSASLYSLVLPYMSRVGHISVASALKRTAHQQGHCQASPRKV
jgi:hypothetical protein